MVNYSVRWLFCLVGCMVSMRIAFAQQTLDLYKEVPNSKYSDSYQEKADTVGNGVILISKVTKPSLLIYHPDKKINTHAAVIICPGGGYEYLAYNLEGTAVAEQLVKWGITAIVLKYRLPSDEIMLNKAIGPLQDAQRAIQLTRIHAKAWNIDTNKVGIMGFSAGGHLAASASTRFAESSIQNIKDISLRPAFSILVYPVISMRKQFTHMGSHNHLIGENAESATEELNSNELQISAQTPPAFLVLAQDDGVVPPDNSIMYFQELRKHKVPVEMHIYQQGGHGFGLHFEQTGADWLTRVPAWLKQNHFIAIDD